MNKVFSRIGALTLLSASAIGLVGCGTGSKIAKMGIDQYFLLDTVMPELSITSAYFISYTEEAYKDTYLVSYDITTTTQAEFDDSAYQSALPTWQSEYEDIVYAEQHIDEYPGYKIEKLNARELNSYIRSVS